MGEDALRVAHPGLDGPSPVTGSGWLPWRPQACIAATLPQEIRAGRDGREGQMRQRRGADAEPDLSAQITVHTLASRVTDFFKGWLCRHTLALLLMVIRMHLTPRGINHL